MRQFVEYAAPSPLLQLTLFEFAILGNYLQIVRTLKALSKMNAIMSKALETAWTQLAETFEWILGASLHARTQSVV